MGDHRANGWFLNEWMQVLGYSQARLARSTGWHRDKVSRLCLGKTPYNQPILEEIARVMGMAAYELLLHPDTPSLATLRDQQKAIHERTQSP
jgi:transcriptional regulator with XRE-family HTH domain